MPRSENQIFRKRFRLFLFRLSAAITLLFVLLPLSSTAQEPGLSIDGRLCGGYVPLDFIIGRKNLYILNGSQECWPVTGYAATIYYQRGFGNSRHYFEGANLDAAFKLLLADRFQQIDSIQLTAYFHHAPQSTLRTDSLSMCFGLLKNPSSGAQVCLNFYNAIADSFLKEHRWFVKSELTKRWLSNEYFYNQNYSDGSPGWEYWSFMTDSRSRDTLFFRHQFYHDTLTYRLYINNREILKCQLGDLTDHPKNVIHVVGTAEIYSLKRGARMVLTHVRTISEERRPYHYLSGEDCTEKTAEKFFRQYDFDVIESDRVYEKR